MSGALILVVDDNDDYRRILSRILGSGGYRAVTARSAEEARLILKTRPPAAALLDWNLPGDSGIDLAREIRRDPALSRLPLLMLSVNSRPEDQVQGLREGEVNAYLTKPVAPAELLARLGLLLGRRGRAS
ncbi:MAG TPA: response regulator [Elusimicrobiota bacterium]|nr:response regulator [Elusimicrobiota bacterium]